MLEISFKFNKTAHQFQDTKNYPSTTEWRMEQNQVEIERRSMTMQQVKARVKNSREASPERGQL